MKDYSQDPSNMSSGIWAARIGELDAQQPADSDSRPVVAVKFIQPSLLPYPKPGYGRGFSYLDWGDSYESPDWIARLEAASYDCLETLQGRAIPYFFGKDIVCTFFFHAQTSQRSTSFLLLQIRTPCGEEAWVLMTEFIDGKSLSDLLGSRDRRQYVESGGSDTSNHFHSMSVEELGAIVGSLSV